MSCSIHNSIIAAVPPLPELADAEFAEPRFDIWASWEEVLALPPKARGEVAEMLLAPKLMAMGLIVAKPFGDSSPWDLVVQAGQKLSRLQVKSAWVKSGSGYEIAGGPALEFKTRRRRCYGLKEIDFIVAYVAPEETWFVFPVRLIRKSHFVIKTDPDWRLAKYRERWELLYGKE